MPKKETKPKRKKKKKERKTPEKQQPPPKKTQNKTYKQCKTDKRAQYHSSLERIVSN